MKLTSSFIYFTTISAANRPKRQVSGFVSEINGDKNGFLIFLFRMQQQQEQKQQTIGKELLSI